MSKNPQIFRGEWWVPAVVDRDTCMNFPYPEEMMGREKKYTGTLTYYGNEDAILEFLHVPSNYRFHFYSNNPVIWGSDANGRDFTLFGVVSKDKPKEDFTNTRFVVGMILIGEHVLSVDKEWSNKCIVHLPYLNNWLFYETRKFINPALIDNTYLLNAALRDKDLLNVELDDGLFWKLCHNIKVEETISGLSIKKTPYFEIETSKPISIYNFLKLIIEFEQFLSIALYGEQNSMDIQFLGSDSKRSCMLLLKNEYSADPLFLSLIKFDKFKDKLPSMLRFWHSNFDKIAPISGYLIDSIQRKNRFDVPDFLIVAQALDGYHKRFVNKKDGKDHRKYEDQIDILLKQFKNVDAIKKCRINPFVLADTRNYYSHLFPDEEKKSAVEGGDLYWLTEKCKVLLTCCILNLLGLTNEEINLCCEHSPISQIIDSLPFEPEVEQIKNNK